MLRQIPSEPSRRLRSLQAQTRRERRSPRRSHSATRTNLRALRVQMALEGRQQLGQL